jgi:tetratricopeptide (TPR) repeat protein
MEPIPFVSLLNFYQRFSPSGKKLFQVFFVLILCAAVAWITGTLQANKAGMAYSFQEEMLPTLLEWMPAQDTNIPYATLQANAYSNYTLELPGLIIPEEWTVWVLLISYCFFWAGTLTLSTRMKQYWYLFPPFLFALFLGQAQVGILLAGTDPLYLVTLGICLAFFLPLYYFRQAGREWSTLIVFFIFLFLLLALLGTLFFFSGKKILFQIQSSILSLQYLLACAAILFASKEPLNLVTALLTNRQNVQSRASFPLILSTWIILLAGMSLWLLGFDAWFPVTVRKVIPISWVILSLVVWPFTAQNAFHAAKSAFGTNLAYTLSILVLSFNALFFFAYAALNGDFLIQLQAVRMAIFLFPIMAFLQIIYWLVNFSEVFSLRQNSYFILHMPTRIRFLTLWIALAIITGIAEGKKNWKTIQLMTASSFSRSADMFLLLGEQDSASLRYDTALRIIPGDPKSNYNSGMMLLKPGQSPLPALERLQACSSSDENFTAGEIQIASYFAFIGKYRKALEVLRNTQEKSSDRTVPNMMAWLYLKLQNPDSAVICLQQALRIDPQYASACSNLGLLYLKFNRPKEARSFFELAKESAGSDPTPYGNLLYAQLAGLDSLQIQWNPDWVKEDAPTSFLYNGLIWCSRNQLMDQADAIAELLEKKGAPSEYLQYKMVRCLQLDSIPQALSRYAWLVKSSPTQAALAAHNLGVFYHQAEVPEMALRFYQDAATWGNPQSQLLGGIVLAQIGNQDSAYKYFTRVRAFSTTWQDQVRKEIALLLLANGQELYASLEWNFDDAQYSDWMRGAQYAAAAGNKAWLIEMLRKAIEVDSSAWQPYDYLGRWYLDKQDPEALQTYLDGLENIPNNPWLQAGYQIACLRLTKAECQPIIPVSDTLGQLGRFFQVEKCIQAKKTSEADSLLRDWITEHPLDTRALYRLGDLWQETGANPDNASEYFFNSISCNDQNSRLWLYYAAFSSAAGLKEQAGYGAIQASQLTREIDQQNNILNTFTEEVKIWRDAGL